MSRRHHARRHARRRNPVGSDFGALIKFGAIGASGSLVIDLLLNYIPIIPTSFTARQNADGSVNYIGSATRIGLAALLASFGRKVFKGAAETMAAGAVVVEFYALYKSFFGSMLPAGSMAYYSPAMAAPGQTVMNAYVSGAPQATVLPGNAQRKGYRGAGTSRAAEMAMYVR
jgi:hypothetical protein